MSREIYKCDATVSDVRGARNYMQTCKKCFGFSLTLQANFLFGLK